MAYRAEIEIGVKGAKKLEQFKQSIETLSNRVDDLNKKSISIQRIKDYVNNLNLAADTLKEVAAGTKEETAAVRNYARALTENNAIQQRQNRLLEEQIQKFEELQRVQRQATGFSAAKYGPQVPEGFDAVKKAAETRTKIAEDASIKEINKRRVEERRLLSDLIDGDLKRIKANGQANEKAFDEFINENKKALADFDKRLDRSIRTRSQQLKKSFKDAAGSAIIGGAFPLLFGQGAGAAFGGAAGGAAGGLIGGQFGFGLSLVGTQLGVLVDQLIGKAANLGQALNTLTADIDAVIAASGKSNTKFAESIKALEDAGLKNTALELATRQLALTVGSDGVEALKTFGTDTERLSNAFSRAMSQMAASVAAFINSVGAVKGILEGVERAVLIGAAGDLAKSDPKVAEALKELEKERSTPAFGLKTMGIGGLVPAPATAAEAKVVKAVKENLTKQAQNIEGLTKQALIEKKNLDTAKQNLQNAKRSFSVSGTANKLVEQQRKRQQEQLDFESKRNEIVTNYEKSIAALRRTVEDQISNLRLQNLKKANELEDQRAANALATLRNQQAAARLFTVGSSPQDPALRATAESLRDAADAYNLKILETEQKRAKLERDSALSVQEIQFRADRFKLNVARQAAELGLNAQKQIDKINKTIVERNSKFQLEKFRNEVKLADLQLNVLKAEVLFEAQKLVDQRKTAVGQEASALDTQIQFLTQLNTAIDDNINTLKNVEPPKAFTEVLGVATAGVDLTDYNDLVRKSINLQSELKKARQDALSTDLEAASLAFLTASSNILKQVGNEVSASLNARNLELEKSARLSELTRELGSQALAQEITNIEFATRAQQAKIDLVETELLAQQQLLEIKVAEGTANETEIQQLERIKQLLIETNKLKGVVNTASESLKTGAKGEIQQFVEQATNELNNLEAVAVRVSQGIGNAIGSSLANGISSLIEGSATVKEVFADMLKSIGQVLVQEGTKMIATYIAIGIARAFAGMGTSGGDPNSAAVGEVLQSGGFTTSNMADQAIAGTFSFASGGYVSGPTRALVGEGGEPEYIIPESKMRESMSRYSRGARGGSVIPESGGSGTLREGGGTAVAAPIDVRYTVERINSVDYVTADQFQRGMQQAASQGAKQGEQQTLKRLQMSGSTRKRLGM